eukprot:6197077-Pleurochrysis_carterae.AAC.1
MTTPYWQYKCDTVGEDRYERTLGGKGDIFPNGLMLTFAMSGHDRMECRIGRNNTPKEVAYAVNNSGSFCANGGSYQAAGRKDVCELASAIAKSRQQSITSIRRGPTGKA